MNSRLNKTRVRLQYLTLGREDISAKFLLSQMGGWGGLIRSRTNTSQTEPKTGAMPVYTSLEIHIVNYSVIVLFLLFRL